MYFRVEFDTDNAAFWPDPWDMDHEVARILKDLARRIERETANFPAAILDVNGNIIGHADFFEDKAE